MLRRTLFYHSGDYKTTPAVAEAFNNVITRSRVSYDHLAIDISTLTAQSGRVTRNLLGSERDKECIKFTLKAVGGVLKRIKPNASVALFFDGTSPMWKVRRDRLAPGKRHEGRFFRSACSPMVYTLEDQLRTYLFEQSGFPPPQEVLISGSATPGPAEGKISQWMLDIASRPNATGNESVCVVGGSDLLFNSLGATPLYNVTTLRLNNGDFTSMTVKEAMEWLGAEKLFPGAEGASSSAALTTLATVRTDATLLLLFANGLSATKLAGFDTVSQTELLDAYFDIRSATPSFGICQDVQGKAGNEIRILCSAFEKVLSKASRKVGVARSCQNSSELLQVLLQTHAMVCNGGIKDYSYMTTDAGKDKLNIRVESLLGHLKWLSTQGDGTITAQLNSQFALTPAELLFLSSTSPQVINQVLPLFSSGHQIPDTVAEEIVETKEIDDALSKTRNVLGLLGKSPQAHRGTTYYPSHLFTRRAGHKGPPSGYEYTSVNLGIQSSRLGTRRTAMERSSNIVVEASDHGKNLIATFQAGAWTEIPSTTPFPEQEVPTTLKVATWNVQFNRHSGETTPLGRAGIDWCSSTRYYALSKVLESCDADVIAMQESEPEWWDHLSKQPWVQQRYHLSCLRNGPTIMPWGVLLLISRKLKMTKTYNDNVPAFQGHRSVMPSLTLDLGFPLTLNAFHLMAPYNQSHVNNRVTQIQNLMKRLAPKVVGTDCIAMGDYNDHPAQFFTMPPEMMYRDAWLQCHPASENEKDSGYTISGKNPYTSLIVEPEFFGRADRVLYCSRRLQPIGAELLGTASVQSMVQDGTLQLPAGLPCPEYLYPSDHFGVMIDFQIV